MKTINALLLLSVYAVKGQDANTPVFTDNIRDDQCSALPHLVPGLADVYTVGVLAIRGFPAAYEEFNTTFSEYLTVTAGKRFERPVKFVMKPLDFESLFNEIASSQVDFFYVNPSAYSCVESEFGAHSLVSQISKRKVGDKEYDLTEFGGVIFARADSDITNIEDIKDRSVAAASISGLGSGQMQFRKLMQHGLHYLNDPSQVVFTSNQEKVVNGVLKGDFDVGFVRTDQIERTTDEETGGLVDKFLLKVIAPVEGLESDGEPFPFESSTELYSEWNVAALNHVPNNVNLAVQEALVALMDHAEIGELINECYDANNCHEGSDDPQECQNACHVQIPLPTPRCETTPSLANIAYAAQQSGSYSGFRTTLTYMSLRDMQEETGFIRKNPSTGKMHCVRSNDIYDAVMCPKDHFKKSKYDVINGCELAGKSCNGFQCLCKPCVKAYEVNVVLRDKDTEEACDKFSVCGRLEQGQELVFLATDNKEREGLQLTVKMHDGEVVHSIIAEKVLPEEIIKDDSVSKFVKSQATRYTHEFKVASNKVGVMMMEVLADGKHIPESPFRVVVKPRDCSAVGENRIPDVEGRCVCVPSTVERGDNCVKTSALTIVRAIVLGFLSLFVICWVRSIRRLQRDHERLLTRLDMVMGSTVNFGFPQLVHKETYGKDKCKEFGLEAVINVNRFIDFGMMVVFSIGFITFAHYNIASVFGA